MSGKPGYVMIKNSSGGCIDGGGGNPTGSRYYMGSCDANNDWVNWEKLPGKDSTHFIYKNKFSQRCMDSDSSGTLKINNCDSDNRYQNWT
jgi:hypothetical protein